MFQRIKNLTKEMQERKEQTEGVDLLETEREAIARRAKELEAAEEKAYEEAVERIKLEMNGG